MTTQSVQTTKAAFAFGKAPQNVNGKGKQVTNGFELFIHASSKTEGTDNSNSQASTTKQASENENGQRKVDVDQGSKSQKKMVKALDSNNQVNDTKNENESSETVSNKVASEEDQNKDLSANQQLITQITGMLQAVQEAAMKALNLNSEELNQLLSEQGMTLTDLLQPEKLQQLVLAGNGTDDILTALTDENLADTLKQLIQTVDEIKTSSNLGLTQDQIKAILEQVNKQSELTDTALPQQEQMDASLTNIDKLTEVKEKNPSTDVTQTDNNEQTDNKVIDKNGLTLQQHAVKEDNPNGSQSSNHKSNEEPEAKNQFQVFVDNMVKSTTVNQSNFTSDMTQVTQLREIVNQIVERIKVSVTDTHTSMELQLNPENLGKVNLTVQSKNGAMTAHFVVQNDVTKQAIESQMQTLRDTLSQQGVKVEAIEVTVSANAFEQNYNQESNHQAETQKNQSGNKITLEDALNMSEIMEEVSTKEDSYGPAGSQIDYTA